MGGISVWQLLIILVIVVLLFGTKRLKGIGTDLGGAIKGFKKAVTEEDKDAGLMVHKSTHPFARLRARGGASAPAHAHNVGKGLGCTERA